MESVSALKLSEAESDGARHRVAWRDGGVVVSWRRGVVASWLGGVVAVERRTEVPVLSQQVSRSSPTVHVTSQQSMVAASVLSA